MSNPVTASTTPVHSKMVDTVADATITADPTVVEAGDEVMITGTGFPAGVDVTVQLQDTEGNDIGGPVTVTVDADCGFNTPITVPEGNTGCGRPLWSR